MNQLEINVEIASDIQRVWGCFTEPEHIVNWNFATDEWHCPRAENDLKPGGRFSYRMEAKSGDMGFDFGGTYDEVIPFSKISYHLDDLRTVVVTFENTAGITKITEIFDVEDQNSAEMQRQGWQAILNNFKKYIEKELK